MKARKSLVAAGAFAVLCGGFCFAAPRDADPIVFAKYATPKNSSVQTEWGTLNCHDPKIFQDDDGTYYVYSTDASIGGMGQKGLQIRTSTDLVNWQSLGTSAIARNWDRNWLKWVEFDRAGASSWAPTVIKQNGLYYMFHGIITDKDNSGDPVAAITLAIASKATGPFYPASTAASKDPVIKEKLAELGVSYKQNFLVRYTYYDRLYTSDDPVITEFDMLNNGMYDTANGYEGDINSMAYGFGCIDPEFVTDVATGKNVIYRIGGRECYGVTYGSWKGGIALMYVDKTSLKAVDPEGNELDVPSDSVEGAFGKIIGGGYGAAYEGAQCIFNSDTGYYYLFVSMGNLDFEYRVGVGRSKDVYGPYLDASGKSMTFGPMNANEYHAVGSKIIGAHELKNEFSFRAQGGQSILRSADGKILFANHARTNYLPGYFFFLQVHQMFFNAEGWPVLNQNDYYRDYNGKDEGLRSLTVNDVSGTYDAVLTVRGTETGKVKHFGAEKPADGMNLIDAMPTVSKEIVLNADGSVGGSYSGSWSLASDGYTLSIDLGESGKFSGFVLEACDWARKKGTTRKTVTFTSLDTAGSGEYFWGNKR